MKNTFLLLFIIFAASSCTITKKLFHKNKTVIDSTYNRKEKADSLTTVDSSTYHKENTTTYTKADSAKSNENTTITEKTTIKEFDTSGKVKKETVIDKKTEINKNGSSGSLTVFENAGKLDSNELKKSVQVSKQASDSGHVTKKEKEVTKEVDKSFKWWWFPLLGIIIIAAIWLYKNRSKVKGFFVTVLAIIRHFFTGL